MPPPTPSSEATKQPCQTAPRSAIARSGRRSWRRGELAVVSAGGGNDIVKCIILTWKPPDPHGPRTSIDGGDPLLATTKSRSHESLPNSESKLIEFAIEESISCKMRTPQREKTKVMLGGLWRNEAPLPCLVNYLVAHLPQAFQVAHSKSKSANFSTVESRCSKMRTQQRGDFFGIVAFHFESKTLLDLHKISQFKKYRGQV